MISYPHLWTPQYISRTFAWGFRGGTVGERRLHFVAFNETFRYVRLSCVVDVSADCVAGDACCLYVASWQRNNQWETKHDRGLYNFTAMGMQTPGEYVWVSRQTGLTFAQSIGGDWPNHPRGSPMVAFSWYTHILCADIVCLCYRYGEQLAGEPMLLLVK